MAAEQDIRQLFERYLSGECNADEIAQLYGYFGIEANEPQLKDHIAHMLDRTDEVPRALVYKARQVANRTGERLHKNLVAEEASQSVPARRLRNWLPYAAAILIATVAATWVFFGDPIVNRKTKIANAQDIAPGGNRATLMLADGRTIDLSETQTGIIVGDGITYLDGSSVISEQVNNLTGEQGRGVEQNGTFTRSHVHTLTTPKGGTYQITLPDGTNVWLNAASTLKYPSRFDGSQRLVEVSGEAYFSVATNQSKPFKVMSNGQVVEVLGTEFNISAYEDEPLSKTTLLEGRVQVTANANKPVSLMLLPGEQSSVSGNSTLTKTRINIKKELAWKAGLFYFEKTSFDELLRQVGRWYDVVIHYEGGVPQESFSGIMSRNVTLKTLLEFLEDSGVNFILENRTLTVRPGIH